MVKISSTPTDFHDLFETTLAVSMTDKSQINNIVLEAPRDNDGNIRTIAAFTGILTFSRSGKSEKIGFDSSGYAQDATTGRITLTDVTRDMDKNDGTNFTAGTNPIKWTAGTAVVSSWTVHSAEGTAVTGGANTWSAIQTITDGIKWIFGATGNYIKGDGSDLKFKDGNNAERTLSDLSASGTDEKTGVSSNDTTPDYLIDKVAGGDGIVITEVNDGADEDASFAVSLATDPGLEIDTGSLRVKVKASAGITRDSDGLSVNESDLTFVSDLTALNTETASSATVGSLSTAENFMSSDYTIAANTLIAGDAVLIVASGTAAIERNGDSPSLNLRVYIGSNVVATVQPSWNGSSNGTDSGNWYVDTHVQIRTIGATGAVFGSGYGTHNIVDYSGKDEARITVQSTTVDTTNTQLIRTSAQFSTSRAGNSAGISNLIVTKINNPS